MVRTFQLVSVFNSMTVWENLVLSSLRFQQESMSEWSFLFSPANRESIRKNCSEAMKVVGLSKQSQTMTSELSYGSKRMLEIGIALSLKPKLLLLDEPLAGLSDVEIVEVLEILHRIKKDLTLIIIEHKLSKITNLVDRLCVMNEGSFICEGEPDQGFERSKSPGMLLGQGGDEDIVARFSIRPLGSGHAAKTVVGAIHESPLRERNPCEIRNLDVAYGHAQVLHGISFRIHKGEMGFFIGRNGAGKTTLLKTIMGLLNPAKGSIRYQDQEITGGPRKNCILWD